MIKTPCLLVTGVNRVELGEAELAEPGPEEVLIETALSSISPGTELRCLAGQQEGGSGEYFPFIPGYSLVGKVVRTAGRYASLEGQVVFCAGARQARPRAMWGAHIGHAVAPAAKVVPIPAGVSLEDASLLKLAGIAYRGVRLARPVPGECAVVVGLGPIGQMSARLLAHAGARVIGVDLSPERVRLAEAAGITGVVPTDGLGPSVRRLLPNGSPIVVDATGARALLPQTTGLVWDKPWDESETPGGRLIVQGSYPGDMTLAYSVAFMKEMGMFWPRDSQRRDLEFVAASLAAGSLSFAGLLGGVFPPAEAQAVYNRLRAAQAGFLTAAFRW